ncbi:glycosyltransferase [Microbulbifer sp. ANSA005]|uniref:glycosyltransferase n=1 Tax=Microbulbifer sp. ANSA005 TaxID=3243362 RepID=UPI0040410596
MSFAKACEHMINYTSGHESQSGLLASQRGRFPEFHIEVDNRLSWMLGLLEKQYGNDAYYVHLTRDRVQTAHSYNKRWDFEQSIMRAYSHGILMRDSGGLDECLDYWETVNSNIGAFLQNKSNKIQINLDNIEVEFPRFWSDIGAEGDLEAALTELTAIHNPSKKDAVSGHVESQANNLKEILENEFLNVRETLDEIISYSSLNSELKDVVNKNEEKLKRKEEELKRKEEELKNTKREHEKSLNNVRDSLGEQYQLILNSNSFKIGQVIVKGIRFPLLLPLKIKRYLLSFNRARHKGLDLKEEHQPNAHFQKEKFVNKTKSTNSRGVQVTSLEAGSTAESVKYSNVLPSRYKKLHGKRDHFRVEPLNVEKKKPVFALCVTTWNRQEYIQKFIETFVATRSDKFHWVLVVADDGSTDGTLEYLQNLHIYNCQIILIKNKNKTIAGQSNSLFDASKSSNFDFGLMCNDDIYFLKEGWDSLYYEAAIHSGFGHLVYHNSEWKKPKHSKSTELLSSSVSSIEAMGCLFSFTPEVLNKVGYFDTLSFPFRGHSHMDFTARCCRAGFNSSETLWDAKGSEELVGMWQRENYKETVDWSSEKVKQILNPHERARRMALVQDDSRQFIQLSHKSPFSSRSQILLSPQNYHLEARLIESGHFSMGYGLNQYVDAVFVLNLTEQVEKWKAVSTRFAKHGVQVERFDAVNGYSKKYKKDWDRYFGGGLTHPVEKQINRKLIQSPGAWGYLLTMKGLLQEAKERRLKRIAVFDDDVILHKDFQRKLEEACFELPTDWKLVYLGCTQLERSKVSMYSGSLYYPGGGADGSFAYMIDHTSFDFLLNELSKFDWPFDSGALRSLNRSYQENSFAIYPNLVIADVTESSIRETRDQLEFSQKAGWDLSLYDFPYYSHPLKLGLKNSEQEEFNKLRIDVVILIDNCETMSRCLSSLSNQSFEHYSIIFALEKEFSEYWSSELKLYMKYNTRVSNIISKCEGDSSKDFFDRIMGKCKAELTTFINSTDILANDYLARMEALSRASKSMVVPTGVTQGVSGKGATFDSVVQGNYSTVTEIFSRTLFSKELLLDKSDSIWSSAPCIFENLEDLVVNGKENYLKQERCPYIVIETP